MENNLSDLYEVFINDLYDSCEKYKKDMFDTIIKVYQNETNWDILDDTKKKLFVFQSFIENKIILNYHYYKTIMKRFLDRLIDNEIYRKYPINFDDNDIYLCYGLICFTLLIFQFYNINIEEFNLDENFINLKSFLEKNCIDIDLKKVIYEKKFKKFKNSKKYQDINKDWLNMLFLKKLDTINITKKHKKKKKIKSLPMIQIIEDGLEEISMQQDNDVSTNEDEYDSKSNETKEDNIDSNQNKIINEESKEEAQIINPLNEMSDPDESKNKLEKEIELLKKENISINKRIDELQNMQLFFFHHISLLQNARDTSKSIYYYFYEFLLKKKKIKVFDKLKEILSVLKEAENKDLQKMGKFLKFIFFLNKYNNKLLHRSISTYTEKLLNKISEKKEYPLMPGFTFKQTFESLCFFLNNLCKDEQVQIILNKVYDEYSSDKKDLGNIFDDKNEVILQKNGEIIFLIEENEIKQIQNYLEKIKLRDLTFEALCDMTNWQTKNN